MSKNKKKTSKAYADGSRETILHRATVREIISLLIGKRFLYAGEVENEEGEAIGLALTFAERGVPEQSAKQWSIYCHTDGRFWIAEW